MGDHDRDAILARRALFMSAALVGIACTQQDQPESPEQPVTPASDPPPVVVETSPPVEPVPVAEGSRPPWSEVMAKAPPLEVPGGLTDNETRMLGYVESFETERYAELEKIWNDLPQCAPSASNCEAWAQALELIEEATFNGWGPLCGYSPETTHAYLERQSAHSRYISELAQLLLSDLDAAVIARGNEADNRAWQAQRRPSVSPRPCLSCAHSMAEPIISAVPFEQGVSAITLTPELDSLLRAAHSLHEQNVQAGAKLIVRGHASADEAEPEQLARQRAEAVVAELVKLGAKPRTIEVRSYAAQLPISNDPAPNRRVDFEVDG